MREAILLVSFQYCLFVENRKWRVYVVKVPAAMIRDSHSRRVGEGIRTQHTTQTPTAQQLSPSPQTASTLQCHSPRGQRPVVGGPSCRRLDSACRRNRHCMDWAGHTTQLYYRSTTCIAPEPGHREPWPDQQYVSIGWIHYCSVRTPVSGSVADGLRVGNCAMAQALRAVGALKMPADLGCPLRCVAFLQSGWAWLQRWLLDWRRSPWSRWRRACDTADMAGRPTLGCSDFSASDKNRRQAPCVSGRGEQTAFRW
jgi:hypothetical protein